MLIQIYKIVFILSETFSGSFHSQHRRYVAASKGREPEVLLVGDSLVQLMPQTGGQVS